MKQTNKCKQKKKNATRKYNIKITKTQKANFKKNPEIIQKFSRNVTTENNEKSI